MVSALNLQPERNWIGALICDVTAQRQLELEIHLSMQRQPIEHLSKKLSRVVEDLLNGWRRCLYLPFQGGRWAVSCGHHVGHQQLIARAVLASASVWR